MKRIVVVGNRASGIQAAQRLLEDHPGAGVVVFPLEPGGLYDHGRLWDYLAGELPRSRLFFGKDFKYPSDKIVFCEEPLERIHLSRRRLVTAGKTRIPFDRLIFCDAPVWKGMAVKGSQKSGHFIPRRLEDFDGIFQQMPLTDTAMVEGDGPAACKAAAALEAAGKEVLWTIPGARILGEWVSPEASDFLQQSLSARRIRIFCNTRITELLGDNAVKAVRLSSGKVIACEMVLWTTVCPDLRLFGDTGGDDRAEQDGPVSFPFSGDHGVFGLGPFASPVEACRQGCDDVLQAEGLQAAAVTAPGPENPDRMVRAHVCVTRISLKPVSGNDIPALSVTLIGRPPAAEHARLVTRGTLSSGWVAMHFEKDILKNAVLLNAGPALAVKFLSAMREKPVDPFAAEDLFPEDFSCQNSDYVLSYGL